MDSDIRQLVKEVLEKGYLMSLATADDKGVWVCDVIYIHDENLNIYWTSNPEVRHSQAIFKNKQVAASITVSGPKEDNLGVQLEGEVEKMEGNQIDLLKKHYAKRGKDEPVDAPDVLMGSSWYVLKPKSIELINEKLYGFEKKKLEL
ncbi:hypothetical protein CL634_07565 [bacterium]|nr:hypothetical protein [bacterium]|tara:strand:+ start:255 stop:695 length:441 start_codon:yes stop_codon:yes gene_type:complete